MDKKKSAAVILGVIFLSTILCACTRDVGIIDDSAPPLEFSEEVSAEFLAFRCGDVYLTRENRDVEWLEAYGEVPEDIGLQDGEFATVSAEIVRVSGGGYFYNGNPEIRKVKSIQKITLDELVRKGEIDAYDTDKKLYGLCYCSSGTGLYCIINYWGSFYLYGNTGFLGRYDTTFEAEITMGLRDPIDSSIKVAGELKSVDAYVIRCDDDYLVYFNNMAFVENQWKWLLNEDFENELPGITLNDGEIACVLDVNVVKVNGGGYSNALMLVSPSDISDCSYKDFFRAAFLWEWERKGSDGEEGEYRRLSDGDYLIILHNGKYHIYQDDGSQQLLKGLYDSASEIDESYGVSR